MEMKKQKSIINSNKKEKNKNSNTMNKGDKTIISRIVDITINIINIIIEMITIIINNKKMSLDKMLLKVLALVLRPKNHNSSILKRRMVKKLRVKNTEKLLILQKLRHKNKLLLGQFIKKSLIKFK
jgi:hypothetical protein